MSIFDLKENRASYYDTHKAAVTILNMLGLKLSPKYRLDLFRLTVKLDKQFSHRPEYSEARALLQKLLIMRIRGLEPKSKNGAYLPRSLDDL